ALVVGGPDGAGLCVWWQPHISATSRPTDPSQATALLTRTRRGIIRTHSTQEFVEFSELLHRSFFRSCGAAPPGGLPDRPVLSVCGAPTPSKDFTDTTNIE